MPYKMKLVRMSKPAGSRFPVSTYEEVVEVVDGIGYCNTETAKDFMLKRGFEYVGEVGVEEMNKALGIVSPETAKTPPQE